MESDDYLRHVDSVDENLDEHLGDPQGDSQLHALFMARLQSVAPPEHVPEQPYHDKLQIRRMRQLKPGKLVEIAHPSESPEGYSYQRMRITHVGYRLGRQWVRNILPENLIEDPKWMVGRDPDDGGLYWNVPLQDHAVLPYEDGDGSKTWNSKYYIRRVDRLPRVRSAAKFVADLLRRVPR